MKIMIKKIKCNKCKKLLPHTYKFFSFHKPGYLRSTCMSCCRKYAKKKFYEYKKNGNETIKLVDASGSLN